jgi:hypothetical protein
MRTNEDKHGRWSTRTVEIKVWKILAALVILPILVLWIKVVHQNDEILALVRTLRGSVPGRVASSTPTTEPCAMWL